MLKEDAMDTTLVLAVLVAVLVLVLAVVAVLLVVFLRGGVASPAGRRRPGTLARAAGRDQRRPVPAAARPRPRR